MGHHSKAYSVVIKNNCVCLYLVIWEKCAMSWPSEKKQDIEELPVENIH